MFGYATELRGSTQWIGEFSMEYKMHQPVGDYEVQDVIDAYAQKKKDKEIWIIYLSYFLDLLTKTKFYILLI